MDRSARVWISVALVVVSAAGLFAPSLGYDFIWDDTRIVREALPALDEPSAFLFPPPGVSDFGRYYRPLTYSVFWAVWASGGGPRAFHALAVALYALSAGLVTLFAYRLLRDTTAPAAGALAAGLLFAVHPAHVEVAAWIGPVNETLPLVLSMAALLAYDAARRGASRILYGVALLACLLAMLCKETAVSLPLLLAGLELQPSGAAAATRRSAKMRVAGLALPWGFYFVLRRVGLGFWLAPASTLAFDGGSLGTLLRALSYYLGVLFAPSSACPFVAEVPPFSAATVALLVLAVGAASALAVVYGRRDFAVRYGLAWILVALAPALAVSISTVATAPLSERYAYVASVGVALIAGALVAMAGRWQSLRQGLVAALVLVGAVTSARRSPVFASDAALWSAAAQCSPRHCLPAINLADGAMARNDLATGVALYRRALDLPCSPRQRGLALAHRGVAKYRSGDVSGAVDDFRASIREHDEYSVPFYMLGRIALARAVEEARQGDIVAQQTALEEARAAFAPALAIRPQDPEYLYAAGQVEYHLGDTEKAALDLRRALVLAPQHEAAPVARSLLATLER